MNEYPNDKQVIATLIELRGVYDGWSIALTTDGSYMNRWAQHDDQTVPTEGYERRYNITELSIPADAPRVTRDEIDWTSL